MTNHCRHTYPRSIRILECVPSARGSSSTPSLRQVPTLIAKACTLFMVAHERKLGDTLILSGYLRCQVEEENYHMDERIMKFHEHAMLLDKYIEPGYYDRLHQIHFSNCSSLEEVHSLSCATLCCYFGRFDFQPVPSLRKIHWSMFSHPLIIGRNRWPCFLVCFSSPMSTYLVNFTIQLQYTFYSKVMRRAECCSLHVMVFGKMWVVDCNQIKTVLSIGGSWTKRTRNMLTST